MNSQESSTKLADLVEVRGNQADHKKLLITVQQVCREARYS